MHILPLKRQPLSYLKVLTVLFCITCPLFQFYAQSPAVGHKGRVNDCTYNAASQSFFTAGADGFVSEWKNDTKVDSYQVSVIPVVKIVAKPDSTIIAVYESDGFALMFQ